MIRFLVVIIIVVVFLIITLPVQLVLWLLGKKWPKLPDKVSYPLVCGLFRLICFLAGLKITVIGKDRIPKDQAVLYIGNHRTLFDIVIAYPLVATPAGFLSKDTFKKVPGLNAWMIIMHCLFLDRNDIKQGLKMILKCIEMIKDGISVVIFPEGTRNREPDTFLEFHEGSFKVAVKSGCPIVPMCLNYSGDTIEDHLPIMKPGRAIIEFGEPIYLDQLEPEQKKHIGAYTREVMMEMYANNKKMLEQS